MPFPLIPLAIVVAVALCLQAQTTEATPSVPLTKAQIKEQVRKHEEEVRVIRTKTAAERDQRGRQQKFSDAVNRHQPSYTGRRLQYSIEDQRRQQALKQSQIEQLQKQIEQLQKQIDDSHKQQIKEPPDKTQPTPIDKESPVNAKEDPPKK